MNLVWQELLLAQHGEDESSRQSGNHIVKHARSPRTSLQLVPSTTQESKDWTILMDSISYYNSNVVPSGKPAHLPFRRQTIQAKHWDVMPAILRYLWIVNVHAMRASRSSADPFSNSKLVQYRGKSLNELQKLMNDVPEAIKDPYGIALYSILFLMGSDMQLPESKWATHLEAARRIIGLKGGLPLCFKVFPKVTHGPLISFAMADIITATTCPSDQLGPTFVQTQLESLELLPGLEEDLIASAYCYPVPLLTALIQTNIFRAATKSLQPNNGATTSTYPDVSAVLNSIDAFDPKAWASRVSAFGRARPETVENSLPVASIICLTSLAQCYKSAVLLYLVYSCIPARLEIDSILRQTVHAAKYSLGQHVRLLFEQRQTMEDVGCDGSLHTQLWKYVSWPIFVHIYVQAAWSSSFQDTNLRTMQFAGVDVNDSLETDLQRLHAVTTALGMRRVLNFENLVRRLQNTRNGVSNAIANFHWSWDDAFEKRSVCVV